MKTLIPETLRAENAYVVARPSTGAAGHGAPGNPQEMNRQGFPTRTGRPWRHPQQIIKLLRSFGGG